MRPSQSATESAESADKSAGEEYSSPRSPSASEVETSAIVNVDQALSRVICAPQRRSPVHKCVAFRARICPSRNQNPRADCTPAEMGGEAFARRSCQKTKTAEKGQKFACQVSCASERYDIGDRHGFRRSDQAEASKAAASENAREPVLPVPSMMIPVEGSCGTARFADSFVGCPRSRGGPRNVQIVGVCRPLRDNQQFCQAGFFAVRRSHWRIRATNVVMPRLQRSILGR